MTDLTIEMIESARQRVGSRLPVTPMIRLAMLDRYLGCEVWAKADCFQLTGSFKIRGAMNMIMSLDEAQLKNGIVTASSGNHGRACAYTARELKIPATVVMPETAPEIKAANIRALGAEVVQCPAIDRFSVAERICAERGAAYIPPYDDIRVMAGQGTMGLEIAEQLRDADTVITPISGGGLTAGVMTAIKAKLPSARTIAAEPAILARYTASRAAGEPTAVPQTVTIADALVSNRPGLKCFPIVQRCTDEIAAVSEERIRQAHKLLLTEGRIFAEPSACIGIGAVLEGKIKTRAGERVCFVISGGNCGLDQIAAMEGVELPAPKH